MLAASSLGNYILIMLVSELKDVVLAYLDVT